ncbi:MAG: SGNH/GDSL hydrolase family protein [Proteobacteria bacterium]|nr:SGNH/GDSL hydrolase family protein [Cystobacterineae bacterium]MCL2259448.1 SGNH/GDSL hydrolase family protein [Cystobacterineae bacterium]MCL2314091.1 SGNH/GDSL hydrolase family protein [Pseudomonadota bacterium]
MLKKFLIVLSAGAIAVLGLWWKVVAKGGESFAYAQSLKAKKKARQPAVEPQPQPQPQPQAAKNDGWVEVPEPLHILPGRIWPPPTPQVGLSPEIFSAPSTQNAQALWDGKFRDFGWQAGKPAVSGSKVVLPWAAVRLAKSYRRILVQWTASGNTDYNQTIYGGPGSYAILFSADSSNGEDGEWRSVVEVQNNRVRTRSHLVELQPGEVFLRFEIRAAAADCYQYGVQIDELSLFDMSMCKEGFACDTWAFVGDSITAMSFDNSAQHRPSFADGVQAGDARRSPLVLNGGIGGEGVRQIEQRIEGMLDDNPAIYYWAIGIGSNDSAGNNTNVKPFAQTLEGVVKKIIAKGRMPILAKIPYASDGQHETIPVFNKAIGELTKKYKLPKGPDLYTHFKSHPNQLADGLHPTDEGVKALQSLWAEVALTLEPPATD